MDIRGSVCGMDGDKECVKCGPTPALTWGGRQTLMEKQNKTQENKKLLYLTHSIITLLSSEKYEFGVY